MNNKCLIQIDKETAEQLKIIKMIPRESYDSVIRRLIKIKEQGNDLPDIHLYSPGVQKL